MCVQVVAAYTIEARGKAPKLGYSTAHILTFSAVCRDWCTVARQHTVWKPLLPLTIPSQDAWQDFQLVQRVVYSHLAGQCPLLFGLDCYDGPQTIDSVSILSWPAQSKKGHWIELMKLHTVPRKAFDFHIVAQFIIEHAVQPGTNVIPNKADMIRRLTRLRAAALKISESCQKRPSLKARFELWSILDEAMPLVGEAAKGNDAGVKNLPPGDTITTDTITTVILFCGVFLQTGMYSYAR